MEPKAIEYYMVVERPVKLVPTKEGGSTVLKYNFKTGNFDYGMEYLTRITFGDEDVEQVSEDEFIQHVEKLRGRNLRGEGEAYVLYELINAMEDDAYKKGETLSSDDKKMINNLRKRTYRLFEEEQRKKDTV
ncbi:MAG: hypothetical protein AAFW75_20875 [Cyanobacteria bacterium J06636_16]